MNVPRPERSNATGTAGGSCRPRREMWRSASRSCARVVLPERRCRRRGGSSTPSMPRPDVRAGLVRRRSAGAPRSGSHRPGGSQAGGSRRRPVAAGPVRRWLGPVVGDEAAMPARHCAGCTIRKTSVSRARSPLGTGREDRPVGVGESRSRHLAFATPAAGDGAPGSRHRVHRRRSPADRSAARSGGARQATSPTSSTVPTQPTPTPTPTADRRPGTTR